MLAVCSFTYPGCVVKHRIRLDSLTCPVGLPDVKLTRTRDHCLCTFTIYRDLHIDLFTAALSSVNRMENSAGPHC